jgi:hypothetical protein
VTKQITIDGSTSTKYEQVDRAIEIDGLPISNYSELTGGGVQREGRTHAFNAKGEIIFTTDGRAVPQNKTIKFYPQTWNEIVRPALEAKAATLGITGDDAYQKAEFTIVDQWASEVIGTKSYTERQSFKVNKDVPDTPADGNPFMVEVELFPTTLPKRTYN